MVCVSSNVIAACASALEIVLAEGAGLASETAMLGAQDGWVQHAAAMTI
jgi:hypothetical protein